MARVGRCFGSIVVEGRWLVGNPKEPCPLVDGNLAPPWVQRVEAAPLGDTVLIVDGEPEAVARLMAARFVIDRNGSVSERLWRVVTEGRTGELACGWLGEVPQPVWQIVRDTVLRCS
jgi:hypothetical protein